MSESIMKTRSKQFAVRIIKLHKYLLEEKKEFVMAKQVLKSGTSIGANIHEGNYAISKKEFAAKMQIALKEAAETQYWLEILNDTDYISNEQYSSLVDDCIEIIKMLTSSIKTIKNNIK